jgi:hypothetical protein
MSTRPNSGGVRHHGFDVGGLAHVGAVVATRTPWALPASRTCGAGLRVAKAVEHDVGALACQGLRNA